MQLLRTFFLIIMASAFLTGCFNLETLDKAVIDKNKELSEKAHDQVGEQVDQGKQKIKDYTKQQLQKIASDLTTDAKDRVEAWLLENSLNQFGDPEDTLYTGGTPLFNEATGESVNRFQYILEQHPELVDKLNLQP